MFGRKREPTKVRDALRQDAAPHEAVPASPPAMPQPDLAQLEAEARYHRERLALYRGRVVSAKETSPQRLHELERTSAAADERLRHARRT